MPIYTYRCTACGNVFEELLPMSAPPPACPAMLTNEQGGHYSCEQATVKIPSPVSRPLGGDTPIHHRNWKER